MKVLVINCGSSSLKYQLIDMETENLLAKGICEQISYDNCTFTHTVTDAPEKSCKKTKERRGLQKVRAAFFISFQPFSISSISAW